MRIDSFRGNLWDSRSAVWPVNVKKFVSLLYNWSKAVEIDRSPKGGEKWWLHPWKWTNVSEKKGPIQKETTSSNHYFFKGHVVLRGSNPMVESIKKHLKNKHKNGFQQTMVHPWRLTWNIIMEVCKIIFLSKLVIWRFHINLPGCRMLWMYRKTLQGTLPHLREVDTSEHQQMLKQTLADV